MYTRYCLGSNKSKILKYNEENYPIFGCCVVRYGRVGTEDELAQELRNLASWCVEGEGLATELVGVVARGCALGRSRLGVRCAYYR